MREWIRVTYEIELVNSRGEEFIESFSQQFNSDIYNEDTDCIDIMVVYSKLDEIRKVHGEVFMIGFSIDRGNELH